MTVLQGICNDGSDLESVKAWLKENAQKAGSDGSKDQPKTTRIVAPANSSPLDALKPPKDRSLKNPS